MEEEYFRREIKVSGRGYLFFLMLFFVFFFIIIFTIVEIDGTDILSRIAYYLMFVTGILGIGMAVQSLFKRIFTMNEEQIKISVGGFWEDSILWDDITEIKKNYTDKITKELVAITFKGKTKRDSKMIMISYVESGFHPKKLAKVDRVIEKHLKSHPEIVIKENYNQDKKELYRRRAVTKSLPWEVKNILREAYPNIVEIDDKMIIYKSPWVSTVAKIKYLENGNTQVRTYWDIPLRTFWLLYIMVFTGFIVLAVIFYVVKAKRLMYDINWKIKLYGRNINA
jgi:hypothetical protein